MGSGKHGAVLSGVFYCVCVCVCVCARTRMHLCIQMYVCMYIRVYVCMYVCFAFSWQSTKVKYILPFSFSSTGILVLLGTNVLGFFHFMKLEI